MAIVDMKRISLLAMEDDREKLLRALQQLGCVQVSEIAAEEIPQARWQTRDAVEDLAEKQSRLHWTITQLGRICEEKKPLFANLPEISEVDAQAVSDRQTELFEVVARVEACERRTGELRGQSARIKMQMVQLEPYLPLPIGVEKLAPTRDTCQFVGMISQRQIEAFQQMLADAPAQLEVLGTSRDQVHIWLILHKQAIELTQGALKDAGFISAQFGETSGTPRQQYAALEAALAQTADDYRKTAEELQAESAHLHELKLLSDCMAIRYERMEAMQCIASTKSTFYLRGWVPAPVVEKVQKKLYALSNVCEIEISDPLEDDPPPTLLANRPVIAPFEAVVSNYSMPAPYGLDPTFIMAPFFACFFGMMVSDAGYGLLMAVLIPIALILLKPKGGIAKIGWIIGIGGVFTFFWGAMFNTWFGGGLKPMLIDPLNQPLEMMGLCLGLGVVHLFTATGVAAYMNFKRGKPWDAVFDQFLWIALISGLPMLFLPATASVGKILAIGGAAGIILTGGRKSPTLLGKIIGGFGSLYNITSWLSDILSYTRLFGMGLATGVIGMVINLLGGMVMSAGPFAVPIGILVLVGGHLFNMAINVLGAYVHACRLQYIEFFGKFYEDGGIPFAPLEQKTRYVSIRETSAEK